MSDQTLTYLNHVVWSNYTDCYVALPDSQVGETDVANDDDTRLSRQHDENVDDLLDAGMLLLDEEQDVAERILALRIHLAEWDQAAIKTTAYDPEHTFEVRPYRKASGSSPDQIKGLVQLLKDALEHGSMADPDVQGMHTWPAARIIEMGYERVARLISDRFREIGLHDCVNTLYQICKGDVRYFDAWEGREPADTREWYPTNHGEYRVLTDNEADQAWDNYLDSLLDDGDVVPGADSPYFDRDRWKRDARIDGRGHSLASYDGSEHMINLDTETYYIFRVG